MSMKGIREDDLEFTNGKNLGHFSVIQIILILLGQQKCVIYQNLCHNFINRDKMKNVLCKPLKIVRERRKIGKNSQKLFMSFKIKFFSFHEK